MFLRALTLVVVASLLVMSVAGCSVRHLAVNTVGDVLASGGSVYETDDDIVLVGDALPFNLKLIESLIAESPRHKGLLLSASRGFLLYSYGYVHFEAEQAATSDFTQARALRERASRLYQRAYGYAMRAIEVDYPEFESQLFFDPQKAVLRIRNERPDETMPMLYWASASLGLAISVAKDDPAMLARLPEVDAMLQRALELDADWGQGMLQEFMVTWAAARPGRTDSSVIQAHYRKALELSGGTRASLFVALAEATALPGQNRAEFQRLLDRALTVDPDAVPDQRLMNHIAQRRAQWLLANADELFLE